MTALDACLMLVAVKQKLMRTRRDLLTELSAEEQNDEQFEALLWNKVKHKEVSSKLRTSILTSTLTSEINSVPHRFEYKANKGKVTGSNPIQVLNDAQLEHLTRLRIRATERAQQSEWIQETFAHAISHVDIAIATNEHCYQVLVDLKERQRLLHQLASEEYHDEQLEREIWDQV
ncbi:unnamed protein product [Penicillium camemberti]|uniref:Str. FM013 n=1 Tax=Penicillium camemberti (strain FM 013) TaxID=1429867 RepID=A0A0G4P315_PENC3|nr:unnamed protein product [Penicillium camemberti]